MAEKGHEQSAVTTAVKNLASKFENKPDSNETRPVPKPKAIISEAKPKAPVKPKPQATRSKNESQESRNVKEKRDHSPRRPPVTGNGPDEEKMKEKTLDSETEKADLERSIGNKDQQPEETPSVVTGAVLCVDDVSLEKTEGIAAGGTEDVPENAPNQRHGQDDQKMKGTTLHSETEKTDLETTRRKDHKDDSRGSDQVTTEGPGKDQQMHGNIRMHADEFNDLKGLLISINESIGDMKNSIDHQRNQFELEIQQLKVLCAERENKAKLDKTSVDQTEKVVMRRKGRSKILRNIPSELQDDKDLQIQFLQEQLDRCEKTINDLKMGFRKSLRVAGIEDVCSKNRPTQVADAYSNLMNNQWLDAYIELPDGTEDEKFKKLIEIMEISWKEANEHLHKTGRNIELVMEDPFSEQDFTGDTPPKKALPSPIERQAMDVMKEICDEHDTRLLSERSLADAIKRGLLDRETLEAICEYIDECCRVAWKMVLQQPQMTLAAPKDRLGQAVDPLKEDIYADSKPKGVISNYVKAGVVQEDKYFVKALVNLE